MELIGILNICKLPGMSSHEVVNRIRRLAGMKRVGHAGTLDPAACGVLLVCLGRATRLSDYIADGLKTYRAEITLGISTDSADAEGDIIQQRDAGHVAENDVFEALGQFTGTFMQRPPAHSAVWIKGQRAYHLARKGEVVDLPLREVTVSEFTPVCFTPGPHPRLLADITCSKGTYIRSLACDLGDALSVGGTLSFLARTAVGGSRLEDSVTLDELAQATQAEEFARYVQSPDTPITHIPALHLTASPDFERYRNGNPMNIMEEEGIYRIYTDRLFAGLGRVTKGELKAIVHF